MDFADIGDYILFNDDGGNVDIRWCTNICLIEEI